MRINLFNQNKTLFEKENNFKFCIAIVVVIFEIVVVVVVVVLII